MPSQLTVPGLIAKWIVAPAALAALGYFLIGPRIGKKDAPPPSSDPAPVSVPVTPAATSPSSPNETPPGSGSATEAPTAQSTSSSHGSVGDAADDTEVAPKPRKKKRVHHKPHENSVTLSGDQSTPDVSSNPPQSDNYPTSPPPATTG